MRQDPREPWIIRGKITAVRTDTAPKRPAVRGRDAYSRAQHVAGNPVADQTQSNPVISIAHFVDQHARTAVVVDDDDVRIAVIVDVAKGRAAPNLRQTNCCPGLRGNVFEVAVVDVVKELLRLMEWKPIAGARKRLDDIHRAIDDEKIGPAVIVVVNPFWTRSR